VANFGCLPCLALEPDFMAAVAPAIAANRIGSRTIAA
jgi:hypothetical protein